MIKLVGNRKRSALIILCTILGLVFSAGLAVASDSGGGHGVTSVQKMDLLYRIINFTLLVIILVVVVRKTAVKDFFSARRNEIEQRFKQLKADRDAAEGRYSELEQSLKDFEGEKARILAQFKADGAKEKEKIIAESRERAAQILAQADQTIEREIEGARDRLRREIVDIAAERARELIAGNIQDSDQDHLVTEFIEKVEKLN
ncbi:MAG: ATP synthase F0 subunit B [Deltaproteobacteria bacterium]|nr:ATP synthase F0 subunit B [Deltaproteobacteria bacterium]MBW1815638.1 ATP synthase F0 subunit B [Deltaproteobacteria bacterium]MBW2283064.1 ATP synthase F0 subunit B [Deltaproteobacteria bacterium]